MKRIGVLLLMCDTPPKKCVASNNTPFFAHESEIQTGLGEESSCLLYLAAGLARRLGSLEDLFTHMSSC